MMRVRLACGAVVLAALLLTPSAVLFLAALRLPR
jgi:hypothetical protein